MSDCSVCIPDYCHHDNCFVTLSDPTPCMQFQYVNAILDLLEVIASMLLLYVVMGIALFVLVTAIQE